jgi:glycosyltransferase involved in cell wall biosynthesis
MQSTEHLEGKSLLPLSIGMPVYNGQKFIEEAICSILSQEFSDFELIISDNASSDQTETICKHLCGKDKRIIYFRQESNIGALRNFEFVLDQARGRFFMWAACDDLWSHNWTNDLLAIAEKTNSPTYGRVRAIDSQGMAVKHVANDRLISFSGSRTLRRIAYFVDPGMRGKSNAFYSIFPTELLRRYSQDFLFTNKKVENLAFLDTLFLYHILGDSELQSAQTTLMYKRIHPGAAGGKKERFSYTEARTRSLKDAIIDCFTRWKASTDWIHYYGISTTKEKFLITLMLPVLFLNKIRWKIVRRLMHDKPA